MLGTSTMLRIIAEIIGGGVALCFIGCSNSGPRVESSKDPDKVTFALALGDLEYLGDAKTEIESAEAKLRENVKGHELDFDRQFEVLDSSAKSIGEFIAKKGQLVGAPSQFHGNSNLETATIDLGIVGSNLPSIADDLDESGYSSCAASLYSAAELVSHVIGDWDGRYKDATRLQEVNSKLPPELRVKDYMSTW